MSKNCVSHHSRSPYIAFVALFFLVLIPYSNSFHSAWHLDDDANITANHRIQIKSLTPESIVGTFYANPVSAGNLYRPVANLTFALNWYVGKNNVVGYHMVNVAVHWITSLLLYLTIINLYRTPKLRRHNESTSGCLIAILAAALWAANPIQTQAVNYIVQRMALLAAMFYLCGVYFYIKLRLAHRASIRITHGVILFISFLLAVGSKENAAMLPVVLILVEMIFFQDLSLLKNRRVFLSLAVGSGILVFFVGSTIFMKGNLLFFLDGYASRPFSLTERIMTEPRIMVHYLSQIFYPLPTRLSIQHDILISTSLFKPWSTLPSIAFVLLLIGIGISQLRKRPLVAFGVLFYFLNHLIESTLIPLELIFEHRNYLPSLFLFWPISYGLVRLMNYYRNKKPTMSAMIASFAVLLLVVLGSATYIRNVAWATEKSLWEDAAQKAPQSSRPLYRLADVYFKSGQLDLSAALLQKGFSLRHHLPKQGQVLYYNNMGNIFRKKQMYEKAIQFFNIALEIQPTFTTVRENLLVALIESGRWDEASKQVDILLTKRPPRHYYLNLRGHIWVQNRRPDKAISVFKKALQRKPHDRNCLLNYGAALSLTGAFEQANEILIRANSFFPNDVVILLWLVENNLKAGRKYTAEEYLKGLLTTYGTDRLVNFLQEYPQNNFSIPLSSELLIPAIVDRNEVKEDEIAGMTSVFENR